MPLANIPRKQDPTSADFDLVVSDNLCQYCYWQSLAIHLRDLHDFALQLVLRGRNAPSVFFKLYVFVPRQD